MLKFKKVIIFTVLITALIYFSGVIMAQSPPGNPDPGFEFPGRGDFNGNYNPFLPDNGNSNPGQVSGPGNDFDYAYLDLNKEAYIYQNGDYNQGSIYQNGRHQALIKQYGENNDANINQLGEDNFAAIKQYGTDNDAEIVQDGFSNFAVVGQFGLANQGYINQKGDNNTAAILQIGDNNQASIEQQGSGLDIEVMIGL
ncbi:MAG: hypothetical protein ACOCQE_03470 [Halanaerobium sp.]